MRYKANSTFEFNDAWEKDKPLEIEVTKSGQDILFTSHFAISSKDARRLAYYILHKTKARAALADFDKKWGSK